MRYIAVIMVCLACCTCSGSYGAPLEIKDVREVVEYALKVLQTGIEHEDPILASQPVSDRFMMGPNIAVRYGESEWQGRGISKFREFFSATFEAHANISHPFTLADLELSGDVATASVEVDFSSLRVDRTPPENYSAAGTDYLIFEREGGGWRLINWDETQPVAPAEE